MTPVKTLEEADFVYMVDNNRKMLIFYINGKTADFCRIAREFGATLFHLSDELLETGDSAREWGVWLDPSWSVSVRKQLIGHNGFANFKFFKADETDFWYLADKF